MSKKKGSTATPIRVRSRSTRVVIVISLVLALLTAGATLAQWSGFFSLTQKQGRKKSGEVVPQSFSPSLPSKEYIYAGGRLIATEEPFSGSTAPSIVSLFPNSGDQGSNTTLTITGSNLAGATAVSFAPATNITVSNINSSSNQVTALIGIGAAAVTGARSVSVTVGGQTSNTLPFNVTSTQPGNPVPTLSSINPSSVPINSVFTIAVNGSNFISNSVVQVNGVSRSTTFNSSNSLSAQIVASDTATSGSRSITVFNPTPVGGTSNILPLTVTSGPNNPVPSIDNISPGTVNAGGASFTLTVQCITGTFVSTSKVRVDGSDRVTTFVSSTQLTAQITAADITTSGVRYITVFNPAPGGGVSNKRTLKIVTGGGGGGGGTGVRGEYFNTTIPTGAPALTRTDPTVNFGWGTGSPGSPINFDQFSVRWMGQVQAQFSEAYTFYVLTDDGVRLWVNNQLLVDKWFNQTGQEWSNTIILTGAQNYSIRMEYYDHSGNAEARLYWSSNSTPKQIIPTSQLFPATSTPPMYEGVHQATNCSTISGWAADRSLLNIPISVEIYDGATLLTSILANEYRPEIAQYLGDNGLHGFTYTVPAGLRDGQTHSISAKFSGTGTNLTGSPQALTCNGVILPSPPTNLAATAVSASQINLTWTDTSNNENGFRVERKEGAEGTYVEIGTTPINVATFSDMGRTVGIAYFYRVRAFNNAGSSSYSNVVVAVTSGGTGGLAPPSNLSGTLVSSSQINLNWTDNSTNETSFEIQRKIVKPGGTSLMFARIGLVPANQTVFSDFSGHYLGYTYVYRVRAIGSAGSSNFSNEASVLLTLSPTECGSLNAFSGSGGGGSYGYSEGSGAAAQWRSPVAGVSGIDPVTGENALFVADTENHLIRMIYLDGPGAGSSILIAGSGIAGNWDGGGDPYDARFNYPRGIAAIKNQNGVVDALLVVDTDNHCIRRLLPPLGGARWRVGGFSGKGNPGYVDGDYENTFFNTPIGIAVGANGLIYVADSGNKAVRVLDRDGYSATVYQQGGAPTFTPAGITLSDATARIFVTDQANHTICEVTGGTRSVLAGSGLAGFLDKPGASAQFDTPYHLAWLDTGVQGSLYIADRNNHRVRVVELDSGTYEVMTWAGNGTAGFTNGSCTGSSFNLPVGLAIAPGGQLYITEQGNTVRKVQ